MVENARDRVALPRVPRASPLAVSNWIHGDPSFLKVRELIEVLDPDLSVADRKLLDAMLAHASDEALTDAAFGRGVPGTRVYSALAKDVKRAMGWESHKSNSSLLEAAKRLQKSVITIGYFAPGDNSLRHRNISLITLSDVPVNQGVVYWRFSPELEKLLSARGERFLVQLKVLAKLTSGYSHRLYQLICANTDRDSFSWTVSVEDLRQVLNAAAASYDSWAAFERRVLRVAVDEVNEHAPFKLRYDLILNERTRRRTHVRFFFEGPASALPPPETKPVQQETIGQLVLDLPVVADTRPLDPPALAARLTLQARKRLKDDFPGAPIDRLIDLWAKWCCRYNIAVDRPARVFERWLLTMFGDLVLATRDGGSAEWAGAIKRDLDQLVCRVMFALSGMVAKQRQHWIGLARGKLANSGAAQTIDVASTDTVYFHRWAQFIYEDFLRAHPL